MSEMTNETAIIVPQMVNLDSLTKIIVAYEKAGGGQKEVSSKEVAEISGLDPNSVGLNNKFFVSIGLLEGKKGEYKLTHEGLEYAQALDWGRLEEAQSLLRKIIKDKPLVQKTVSYVELNKPVQKDDLIAKIAIFANVPNQARYSTGIKAFVEMLTLSKIFEEKDGSLIPIAREEPKEKVVSNLEKKTEIDIQPKSYEDWKSVFEKMKKVDTSKPFLGFNVTINIDNNTDPEKLRQIIKVIKDAALSQTTD